MNIRAEGKFWARVAGWPNHKKVRGCWLWTGYKDSNGYGRLGMGGKYLSAHRVSMVLAGHVLADGDNVLHRCDVPACVRPSHPYVGTLADNNRDTITRGRAKRVRGDGHHNRKLSEANVQFIRRDHASGRSITSLARDYKVDWATMQSVVKRETWRHVPDVATPGGR